MSNWMPVFLVFPARRSHHAAHPDHKGAIPKSTEVHGKDFLQRIGTAIIQDDGSYLVELAALPLSGRLLIRPPTEHDHRDPSYQGDR
jgi:hypothetical protein